MAELKEVFEMVTKQTEPDLDSWKQQEDRHRRSIRNRKLGTVALVAAIIVGLSIFALVRAPGNEIPPLTSDSNSTSAPPSSGVPPLGTQVISLSGSVQEQITAIPDDAYGPQRSPDGSTVAFMNGAFGSGNVRVATIEQGSDTVRVLTGPLNNAGGDAQEGVSWSPDGTQIAYAANDDIYVMDSDGSNVRRLTSDPGGDYHPSWSSTGLIAYWHGSTTGEDGGPRDSEIYTIPATGGAPTRLTHDDVNDIEPAWSPDGSRIVYFHDGELWIMRADGSRQHHLLNHDGAAWAPAWSPDGTRIAFLSYVDNVDGSGAPILEVGIVDLATKEVTNPGARVLTDLNGPQWVSNNAILINRYD